MMERMTTLAYIRKSVVHAGQRTLSWEMQEAAVLELAGRYGDDPLILSDWNKSGRSTSKRPGYRELVDRLEAGGVTAIYAYSLSRLSRSLTEYSRLAEYCVQAGVRLRLAKEGEIDFGSPSGRLIVTILAAVAQMEAELAQERSRDAVNIRRAKGESLGRKSYGQHPGERFADVEEAYELAGSFHGAARLLNLRGAPTRLGRPWRGGSVRAVIEGQAPHLLPAARERGVAKASGYRLARLLRCDCGGILTPKTPRGGVRYQCQTATDVPGHPSPKGLAESAILPWVMEEIAKASPPQDVVDEGPVDGGLDGLLDRKRRAGAAYLAGALDDRAFQDEVTAVDVALARLSGGSSAIVLGEIDWEADPRKLNELLRALLVHVQLDPSMRPVEAVWRVPWTRPATP